jgi:hypothetical protein
VGTPSTSMGSTVTLESWTDHGRPVPGAGRDGDRPSVRCSATSMWRVGSTTSPLQSESGDGASQPGETRCWPCSCGWPGFVDLFIGRVLIISDLRLKCRRERSDGVDVRSERIIPGHRVTLRLGFFRLQEPGSWQPKSPSGRNNAFRRADHSSACIHPTEGPK